MTITKHALKPTSHQLPPSLVAERTERQNIGNTIIKIARIRPIRLKAVGVFPARKRPLALDVAKLSPFAIIAVFRDPFLRDWAKAQTEHDPVPVVNPSCPLDDFDRHGKGPGTDSCRGPFACTVIQITGSGFIRGRGGRVPPRTGHGYGERQSREPDRLRRRRSGIGSAQVTHETTPHTASSTRGRSSPTAVASRHPVGEVRILVREVRGQSTGPHRGVGASSW